MAMRCVCLAQLSLLLTLCSQGQLADFGDLPDPPYISAKAEGGPYHLDVSHEWIGLVPGGTDLESDALVQDKDDGEKHILLLPLYESGRFVQTGQVCVPITTDADPTTRYLNVVADLNNDGQFKAFASGVSIQAEWLAVNVPIVFQNATKMVVTNFELLAPLNAPPCMRVTLSTEMIARGDFGVHGWDGSGPAGGFARGETEDLCAVLIERKEMGRFSKMDFPATRGPSLPLMTEAGSKKKNPPLTPPRGRGTLRPLSLWERGFFVSSAETSRPGG